jgi:hypothetical protein
MKLNPNYPKRQDVDTALLEIQATEERHERMANGFYGPPTLWQTFQKHALGIIGGTLLWAALLYLIAFIRGVL